MIWLLLGGALSVFSIGRWPVAWAAWLAPVLLLHFARSAQWPAALPAIWLVLLLALALSHRGALPFRGPAYYAFFAAMAAFAILPYIADHLLAPRIPGLASTLIFALTWMAAEFLASLVNPFGTWGSLAYTQYGNLPLMQMASVTGIWGITFQIAWFASLINRAWNPDFVWAASGTQLIGAVVLCCCVLLAGGLRLALSAPAARSVRVAGIGWPDDVLTPEQMMRALAPSWSEAERTELRQRYHRLQDYFLDHAACAARGGAALVLTPESSLFVLREDEATFLTRAMTVARDNQIHLLLGMVTVRLGEPRPIEDKAILIKPSGEIILDYMKASAVPGQEASTNVRGRWRILSVDLAIGRVAVAICYDLDFPRFIRQAGQSGADLLLVPAGDWREIGLLHYIPAVFRAIENGTAMVRVTRWGLSGAVDRLGHSTAEMDHFAVGDRVMMAQVPIGGARTVYSYIGDAFAWLGVLVLVALAGYAVLSPAASP